MINNHWQVAGRAPLQLHERGNSGEGDGGGVAMNDSKPLTLRVLFERQARQARKYKPLIEPGLDEPFNLIRSLALDILLMIEERAKELPPPPKEEP